MPLVPVVDEDLLVESSEVAESLLYQHFFAGVAVSLELEAIHCVGLALIIGYQLIALHFYAGEIQPIVPHVQYTVHLDLHLPSHSQPVRKFNPPLGAVSTVLKKFLVVPIFPLLEHILLDLSLTNQPAMQLLYFFGRFGLFDDDVAALQPNHPVSELDCEEFSVESGDAGFHLVQAYGALVGPALIHFEKPELSLTGDPKKV